MDYGISNWQKEFWSPAIIQVDLGNVAGWQLARVLTHMVRTQLSASARFPNRAPDCARHEDGVVIIQTSAAGRFRKAPFLLRDTARGAIDEIRANRGKTGLDFTTVIAKGDSADAQFASRRSRATGGCLTSSRRFHATAFRPQLGYQLLTMLDGEEFVPDAETILHADRHYPTIKAYYSLNGSTTENGAYVWVPKSHRLTAARLRYEYADSIRFARSPAKHNLEIPESHLKDMGLIEKPILTEPNTMVISNNFGFHRRGYFSSGAVREQLRLVFHYLEEPFYATMIWNTLRG